MMKTIGFLGLGVMGLPMAINLTKKSQYRVIGYDVFKERSDMLVAQGGIAETDPSIIFETCDIIFLCMPTNELLAANVEKIIQLAKPNTVVVDFGSTSPDIIQKLHKQALAKNIYLIDSPVSGGEIGAINGSLVLMCGGEKEVFDKIKPLLECVGSTVTYMGASGFGSIAKLANNIIVACNIASACEAFAFAVKAGLNPTTLFDAIKNGFAGSTIMSVKIPKIISRDFSASARIAVHMKDLKNAKQFSETLGVDIPLSNQVLGYMQELELKGYVNEDQAALARIYEERMKVKIK
ncbi:NAD(P)-dependent oxidoreductase [Zophobihabitans entericus]|uniref:Prephenate dehydrogenase/arogenate dehydrogenase family protein n=1 Tax=Zophobihabitans entericus TaxID=1635327 RepID=A0A6G9I8N5_9GAMM|nr:prephenate dehydrogenase/arogenate dehydrogenase family protein [Zophobihabitans entericus]QIQ20575.1 prephenate dehydrogenase/arogenate dehydrogenase family protein [Zophobihabitans entericus]